MAQDKNKTDLVQKETTSREELFITALDSAGKKANILRNIIMLLIPFNNCF